MSKRKLRPVYMTDEAYKSAQDKADELGLSFSSYMSMLAKKDLKNVEIVGHINSKPIKLLDCTERGRSVDSADKKRVLTENIVKWSLGKELNLSDAKIKLIVNKVLEETK